jgi:hypothetical protein
LAWLYLNLLRPVRFRRKQKAIIESQKIEVANQQSELQESQFSTWKSSYEQVDDAVVIGLHV